MPPGAASAPDFASQFLQGFEQGRQQKIIQRLMEQLSGVFDPVRSTTLGLPPQPSPDIMGTPAGSIPRFFNTDIPNPVTTEQPAGRMDVARRAMAAIGQVPEGLGVAEKLLGGYFKPGAPQAPHAIGERGLYDPNSGKVIAGIQPPPKPVVVDKSLVMPPAPGSPAGTKATSIYDSPREVQPGMFDVQTDNDGNVTVVRKDTGESRSMGKIGKATAGPARYHYGMNAKGELVQIDTITGRQKAIPGVFGPEYLKMTFDQRNKSTDQLYSRLLEKFMAGKASQAELETLNMLTDMKSKQGVMYMLQTASETGKFPGPPPRPWEQPKEEVPPPPAKEKGPFDFLRPNAPDIKLEKDNSGKPKFRQPGAAPPASGSTSYKFSVGADSYTIRGPQGKASEQVKADVDQIGEALKQGATMSEIITELEKAGYTITRPGSSPGRNGVSETIQKR